MKILFRLLYIILSVLFFIALVVMVIYGCFRWLFTGKSVAEFSSSMLYKVVDKIR